MGPSFFQSDTKHKKKQNDEATTSVSVTWETPQTLIQTAYTSPGETTTSLDRVVQWIQTSDTMSDWKVVGFKQARVDIPSDYLQQLTETIQAKNGEFRKVTDYERMVLAILACGGDPRNVAGYDLIEKIYNNERMTNQGANGVIFALVALDAYQYEIPDDAQWNRTKLTQWLLDNQNEDGSWSLAPGWGGDVDITAMTLTALAPYTNDGVIQARERGFSWLSSQQTESGGFQSWGVETSESASQVIIALASNGKSSSSPAFTKAGGDVLQNLLRYQNDDGGFAHLLNETSNSMASEQALLALVAHQNVIDGKRRIYDFTPELEEPEEPEEPEVPESPSQPTEPTSSQTQTVVVQSPQTVLYQIYHAEAPPQNTSNQWGGRQAINPGNKPITVQNSPVIKTEVPISQQSDRQETVPSELLTEPTQQSSDISNTLADSAVQEQIEAEKNVRPQLPQWEEMQIPLLFFLCGILAVLMGGSYYVYDKRRKWQ
ncbi:terpene cyclase/mutase family protein [Hazenella sp. IB182357]|uniref:Terpene cyclase/mutase family protein n=1 Tax=Polycladospora coralii TaxID=2771432 RepID=A0A926RTJ1_9BACL|nr:terpene cyclase/mutase family protein [Polycladospora coralii]